MEDKQLTEQQLQALLRLKRHEQPPPGYFDDLLKNIHRRQREELLHQPAWKISLERLRTFFGSMRLDWNYAGTMAAVLLIGIGAIQIALPTRQPAQQQQFAQTIPSSPQENVATVSADKEQFITLQPGNPSLAIRKTKRPVQNNPQPGMPTRFVIDAQPASYEPAPIRF